MSSPISSDEFEGMSAQEIAGKVIQNSFSTLPYKMERNADLAFPVIKNVYETSTR